MACNDCPELIPNPNEGCLKPILSSCVTFDGEGNLCVDTTEGQNLNQIIQKLSDLVCEAKNSNWLNNLNVSCLVDFPTLGTTQEKYQYIIDNQCSLQEQINTIILNSTTIANVGGGAEIFKGLNSNINELKSLKKSVIQPTNPDMLSGDVAVNIKNNTNDIEFEFDFSTLKVSSIPAEGSIKTYYVFQTTSNAYVGDGSVSRPYKNWTDCKNAIIGTGDFTAPQNNNSRVIFLNNITSNESLTVNTLIYEFRNSSIFNYKPVASETLDDAVIDFQKIINTSPSVSINIKLTGTGTITREDTSDTSKQVIIRHKGGLDGINRTLDFTENCNITLQEKKQPINIFTACINPDTALPLTASNGNPIYVVNNDLPMPEGLFSCVDSNNASSSEVYIRVGSTLNIVTNAQVGIYNSGSSIQNYGTIIFSNHRPSSGVLMRYDSIDGTITSPYNGRYTPHLGLSMIKLLNNGTFNTFSSGAIYYNLSGSIKQGGFNSFVELEGGSTFTSTSDIGLVFEEFAQFNHLLHIKGNSANNVFNIKRLNTRLNPRKSIFSADNLAESVTRILTINGGTVETDLGYASETSPFSIYSSPTMKANTTIRTNVLLLSGLLTFDFLATPTTGSTGFANFVGGTIYRKNDGTDWLLAIKS